MVVITHTPRDVAANKVVFLGGVYKIEIKTYARSRITLLECLDLPVKCTHGVEMSEASFLALLEDATVVASFISVMVVTGAVMLVRLGLARPVCLRNKLRTLVRLENFAIQGLKSEELRTGGRMLNQLCVTKNRFAHHTSFYY